MDSKGSTIMKNEVHEESLIRRHWESYINDLMVSGNVKDAALYELKSGKILASNREHFGLAQDEYNHIVDSFNKPLVFRRTGISVNGRTYKTHLADGHRGIMGKMGVPAVGCSICKTRSILIVAVHDGSMNATKCNDVVMNMGDFFYKKAM